MDNNEFENNGNKKPKENQPLATDVLKYSKEQTRTWIKVFITVLFLWAFTLIGTISIFIWYLYQYDFSGTIEQTGIYTIVDSDGNVISSDIDQEQLKQILEILNGEGKNN